MPDHLLRELADDTPPLRPGFADEIVALGRHRLRRRWAIASSTAVAAAVAIAVPLAVRTGSGTGERQAADSGAATVTTATDGRPSNSPASRPLPVALVRGGVYYAALTWALQHPDSGGSAAEVIAVDAVCAGAASAATTGCTGRIQPDVTSYLSRLDRLAGAPWHYVRSAPRFGPSDPPNPARVYALVGPAQLDGAKATIWVEQICGFDCVRGDQLTLRRIDGVQWEVTGTQAGYVS